MIDGEIHMVNTKARAGDYVRPIRRHLHLLPIVNGTYEVQTVASLHTASFDGTSLISLKEYPNMMFFADHFEIVHLKDELFEL